MREERPSRNGLASLGVFDALAARDDARKRRAKTQDRRENTPRKQRARSRDERARGGTHVALFLRGCVLGGTEFVRLREEKAEEWWKRGTGSSVDARRRERESSRVYPRAAAFARWTSRGEIRGLGSRNSRAMATTRTRKDSCHRPRGIAREPCGVFIRERRAREKSERAPRARSS